MAPLYNQSVAVTVQTTSRQPGRTVGIEGEDNDQHR
jgi:hypothetical protein